MRSGGTSRTQMLRDLSMLKMDNWYKYLTVTDLYKYLRNESIPYTLRKLDWRARIYYTRKQTLNLNFRPKVLHGSLNFLSQAVSTWNKLDITGLGTQKTYEDLKTRVKGILLDTFDNFYLPP